MGPGLLGECGGTPNYHELNIVHQTSPTGSPCSDKLPAVEYAEEKYARHLRDKLARRIASLKLDAHSSIDGGGVHWHCSTSMTGRSSLVHCFALPQEGPEYLTSFRREGEEIATARTSSPDDTVEAIMDWLNGADLRSLHDRYQFLDRAKRALTQIRDSILKIAPGLENGCELKHWGSGIYYLWFRQTTRSAVMSFYGKNEIADVVCHWDDCSLFSFPANDLLVLGTVLKRWLSDGAMPSQIRGEFPTLSIGKLADYYERGNPIEGEFIDSWDRIREFYDHFYDQERYPTRDRVLQFVDQLRQAGYDRKFRAGQSLWTFILSRSRRHGLRIEQPIVHFHFSPTVDEMLVTLRIATEESTFTTAIATSDQLRAALTRLSECSID